MRHETEVEAEAAALCDLAAAVSALLERLRAARGPGERDALRDEFTGRIDGIREALGRRYRLEDGRVEAVVARSLAHIMEVIQATPSRA